jgi:D-lactate dehydrogenase
MPLREAGADALEVMDRAALASVERQPGIPATIARLPAGAAGLLVEFQAMEERERAWLARTCDGALGGLVLLEPPLFTHDPAGQAALWRIRKGMFPSVGAMRASGTTVIIEDVAFPVERLADAVVDHRAFVVTG